MTRHGLMRLLESYFRHLWLYLLPIVMMVGAFGLSFIINKPKYISHGVLYVQKESLLASLNAIGANNSSIWGTPAQSTSYEINDLLQTDAFIRAIIQQTDLEQKMGGGQTAVANLIKDVRKDVWTTPLGDNQLQISGSDTNPMIAAQLVNGIIEGYSQWKLYGSQSQSEAAQGFFNDLIKNYQAELNVARQAMNTYLIAHPQPLRGDRPELEQLEIKRLQGDIDLASTRLSSALDKEENARLAQVQNENDARQTYVLIDAPQTPLKPEITLKQLAVKFGLFVAVGIILSLTAIIGGALLDRSVRFPADVTNSLNLPVLAVVPEVNLKPSKRSKITVKERKLRDQVKGKWIEEERSLNTAILPQPVEMAISKKPVQKVKSEVDLKV